MTAVERSSWTGPSQRNALAFDVLAIDVSHVAKISAWGELDDYGARRLGDCLVGLVADGWPTLDLELAEVTLAHFDGVLALQGVLHQLERAGATVTLRPADTLVVRLLSGWRHAC